MKKNRRFFILAVLLVMIIAAFFAVLTRRKTVTDIEETTTEVSKVQQLIQRNISVDYPPTPKEVLKLYADITVSFYTENYTDEEFEQLADKIRELYDPELLLNNPRDAYLSNLKSEVSGYKTKGIKISSYATSSATDVDYFSQDGFKFARLNLVLTVKQEKEAGLTKEKFLLRKDMDGHWKIYGWKLIEEGEE